jgi:hypothetical protein
LHLVNEVRSTMLAPAHGATEIAQRRAGTIARHVSRGSLTVGPTPLMLGGGTGRQARNTDVEFGSRAALVNSDLPLPFDDGGVLNQLAVWAPDAALHHTILVENPARLYGF